MNTDFDEIHSMILLNDSSISLDIIRRLDIYITEFSFGNTEGTSVLLNQKNVNKYTMLHSSIFGRNLDIFSYLVKNNADINIKCHGTPVLHLLLAISIQPESKEFALDAVRILMDRDDIEFDARDDQNATILHLIAEYNCIEIGELIFKLGNLSSLIHTKDRIGWFPLHRAGSKDAVAAFELLLEWGASLHVTTSMNTNILHICSATSSKRVWNIIREKHSDSFNSLCNQNDNFGRTPVETAQLYGFSADDNGILHSTVIVSDSLCLHHHTCAPSESVNFNSAPPENINRLKVLIDPLNGVLHASDLQSKILHVSGVKEATISDVLRVHEWSYIRKIQTKCEQIDDDPEYSNGIGYLDGDTTISKDSFNAALKAAGCVIHAIDLLVNEHSRNAFCPIRPPGHHAGPKGVSKEGPMSSDSHGFCLINNVSIGAAYALNVHRDVIKKVAIVDFDVHHGNGTEETVRWLQPGVDEFPLQGSNFFANVQTPRYKPWFNFDDSNNVFFVSVHGFGPRGPGMESFGGLFYPGSGSTKIPEIKKHQEDNNSTLAKDSEENNDALSENEEDEEFQSVEEREDNENSDDRSSDNDYNVEEIEIEEADEDSIDKKLLENLDPGSFRKIYTDQKKSPLVLDVGVGLPEATISPSEYRHRWRNYFRNVIFPSLNTFQPDIICTYIHKTFSYLY